ncbi:MAG: NfeD family protein [Acidimicrobiaceae bacterium]|nr:NfeD family protein [Acidimicrobiaceae bacterium]
MAVLFWVVIIVLSGLAELHTNALAALFVGVGAGVAFVVALGGASFPVQALVWLVVTALTMGLLRPYALKKLRPPAGDLANPILTTLTGQFGVVEDEVGDEIHPGRIKIHGEHWRAVTDVGASIAVATPVVVTKAYGTTLWVEPRESLNGH